MLRRHSLLLRIQIAALPHFLACHGRAGLVLRVRVAPTLAVAIADFAEETVGQKCLPLPLRDLGLHVFHRRGGLRLL